MSCGPLNGVGRHGALRAGTVARSVRRTRRSGHVRVPRRRDEEEDWSPAVLDAVRRAERLSLGPPRRPRDERPDLDEEDLTEQSDEDLIELLRLITVWADYSTVQLGLAAAKEKELLEKAEDAEAQALIRGWGEATPKQDYARARKRMAAEGDRQRGLEAYALRKLLEGVS